MKTNYFTKRTFSIYSFLGIMAMLTASCGSYQSSSYYDSDGIYGNSQKEQLAPQENPKSNQYKEYFSSLKNEPVETFTDVDNYNSYYPDSTSTSNPENYSSGYAGWGGDSDNVTVNVYGNNWGYNYWNDWYGPYWGWGWNSWYGPSWSIGLGWGSWYGWGYPYYGYYGWDSCFYGNSWSNNHYYNQGYRSGRRGYYGSGVATNNSIRHYNAGRRSYTQYNGNQRSRSFTQTRGFNRSNQTRSTTPRSNQNTYYNTPRNNNNTRAATPSRSYSQPSYSSGSRSSGSYGGGSSNSGSRGGGRR